MSLSLNRRAAGLCQQMIQDRERLRIAVHDDGEGAVLLDCGVAAPGGLEAGRCLAEVCLADLATVSIVSHVVGRRKIPGVLVRTDHPVSACLASQYAGWQISGDDDYFAMGSGPMRAAAGREALFDEIPGRESSGVAVGVLETARHPSTELASKLADACDVDVRDLTLLLARTSSMAGNLQVVARSIETAIHKLHELKFDVSRILHGLGVAPLPPVAADDLVGIGRTNDAVLYGGEVTLWVSGDDDSLAEVISQVPSSASVDFGRPFAEVFAAHGRDFYQVDPLLFSPAIVTLMNIHSGRCFTAGEVRPDVLEKSFGSANP